MSENDHPAKPTGGFVLAAGRREEETNAVLLQWTVQGVVGFHDTRWLLTVGVSSVD